MGLDGEVSPREAKVVSANRNRESLAKTKQLIDEQGGYRSLLNCMRGGDPLNEKG